MDGLNKDSGQAIRTDLTGGEPTESSDPVGEISELPFGPPSDPPAARALPGLCDEIEEGRLWARASRLRSGERE